MSQAAQRVLDEEERAFPASACKEAPVPEKLRDYMEGWLVSADPASEDISGETQREGSLLWEQGGLHILPSGNSPSWPRCRRPAW